MDFGSSAFMETKVTTKQANEVGSVQPLKSNPTNYKNDINGGSSQKQKRSKDSQKPSYSYVRMIITAITSAPCNRMSFEHIIRFIEDNFPHYKGSPVKKRNTIKRVLRVNSCFVRLSRDSNDSVRDHFWTIDPARYVMFNERKNQGVKPSWREPIAQKVEKDIPLRQCAEETNVFNNVPPQDRPQVTQTVPQYLRVPVITRVTTTPKKQQRMAIDNIYTSQSISPGNHVVPVRLYYPQSRCEFANARRQRNIIPHQLCTFRPAFPITNTPNNPVPQARFYPAISPQIQPAEARLKRNSIPFHSPTFWSTVPPSNNTNCTVPQVPQYPPTFPLRHYGDTGDTRNIIRDRPCIFSFPPSSNVTSFVPNIQLYAQTSPQTELVDARLQSKITPYHPHTLWSFPPNDGSGYCFPMVEKGCFEDFVP